MTDWYQAKQFKTTLRAQINKRCIIEMRSFSIRPADGWCALAELKYLYSQRSSADAQHMLARLDDRANYACMSYKSINSASARGQFNFFNHKNVDDGFFLHIYINKLTLSDDHPLGFFLSKNQAQRFNRKKRQIASTSLYPILTEWKFNTTKNKIIMILGATRRRRAFK